MSSEEIRAEIEEQRERILNMMRPMEYYSTTSDIGGVRISSCDFSAVYSNGYGDGTTNVIICEDDEVERIEDVTFEASFDVLRSGSVWLMSYDCDREGIKAETTLKPGRYYVYRNISLERMNGLVVLARQVERVETREGGSTNYNDAVERMDDEVREQVHADFAPCSHQEFFNRYCVRHFEKFGEDFSEQLDVETYDD